jgi:diguanylate cyclase (GGDEF)-like protein/PAS domain S-box-containing protein
MNLSNFILDNIEDILQEWEQFARTIFPIGQQENIKKLRDHARNILLVISNELTQFQSKSDQTAKSRGLQMKYDDTDTAAEKHGAGRMVDGFNINEMVSEFRALRASVTKLFTTATKEKIHAEDIIDLIRFNEGIDQALSESVARYSHAAEQQNRLFETMLSSSPDLNYILDLDGKFLYVNPAMSELYQKDSIELIGEANYNLAMPSEADVLGHIQYITQMGERCRGEVIFQTSSNNLRFFEYIYGPVFNEKGNVEAIACASRDVTERKSAEEKIWQCANYDPLTELVNRRLFREKLVQTLKHSKRSGKVFYLLFIDLDNFKTVNDTLGHNIGDILLKQTAKRIKGCMRETDIISRIGGDEFNVIIEDAGDVQQVLLISKKILTILHKPFSIKKNKINISASIGIALSPDDGITPDTLIKNADMAMYLAKKDGGNRLSLYKKTS